MRGAQKSFLLSVALLMLNTFKNIQCEQYTVTSLSVEFISFGQQSRLCILF